MQNLPLQLYRAADVRALDRLAITQYGIPGFELMTRAGTAVFTSIRRNYPRARALAVFCGGGNNAGDGYVVAALARSAGYRVKLFALTDPAQLSGDAATACRQFTDQGGVTLRFSDGEVLAGIDLIVDALLGTGLDRPVSGVFAGAIAAINQSGLPVIAIDIPSGLHADTGAVMETAVKADRTLSFIGLKQGLFTGEAADYCGVIEFAGLEVPEAVYASVPISARLTRKSPWPPRKRCSHKGHYGHVLVIGGNLGYSGAARLAAQAALRTGAGLVSLATRSAHAQVLNMAQPELMCAGVETVEQLAPLLEKASVLAIGPGLAQDEWAKTMLDAALTWQMPRVMDADALNLLAQSPARKDNWVLTPHPGEAARLLAMSSAQVQQDRFAAATALQAQYGGVAVLKGAGTLIKSTGCLAVSCTGNPGMASGGMGDVLTGVIAGLIAQGLDLATAAEQGVYVHGLAADSAAKHSGERGLAAGDLLPWLRHWVNQ